jgi:DMSO/TMAO reductase YedYZ heme-binding membrane subunit
MSSYGSALLLSSSHYVFLLELFLKKTNEIFKLIIPVVFISLLLLLSYKIVSKINHKRSSSKHKNHSRFYLSEFKGESIKKI